MFNTSERIKKWNLKLKDAQARVNSLSNILGYKTHLKVSELTNQNDKDCREALKFQRGRVRRIKKTIRELENH